MDNSKQPWQMTKEEWNRERESVRPDYVQARFTKGSGSQAVASANRLQFLLFGVRSAEKNRLDAAAAKEIKLTRDEVDDLLDCINTPVSHYDVVVKALAEGCPVQQEVLSAYPAYSKAIN